MRGRRHRNAALCLSMTACCIVASVHVVGLIPGTGFEFSIGMWRVRISLNDDGDSPLSTGSNPENIQQPPPPVMSRSSSPRRPDAVSLFTTPPAEPLPTDAPTADEQEEEQEDAGAEEEQQQQDVGVGEKANQGEGRGENQDEGDVEVSRTSLDASAGLDQAPQAPQATLTERHGNWQPTAPSGAALRIHEGNGYGEMNITVTQTPPQASRDQPQLQRAAALVKQHGIPPQIRVPDDQRTNVRTPPDSGSVLLVEQHLGEWAGSGDHRITTFGGYGLPFKGDDLRQSLLRIQLLTSHQLEACGTPYTLWMGTMIGAYRHHGPVPWDADVDLLIEYKSLAPLLKCLEGVKPDQRHTGGLRWVVRWPNSRTLKMNDVLPLKVVDQANGYYADIFVTFCDKDGKCSYNEWCPDGMREAEGMCSQSQVKYFKASDLWPPRTCLFQGHKTQCSPGTQAILELIYVDDGKGWRSEEGLGVPEKYRGLVSGELFSEPEWV